MGEKDLLPYPGLTDQVRPMPAISLAQICIKAEGDQDSADIAATNPS